MRNWQEVSLDRLNGTAHMVIGDAITWMWTCGDNILKTSHLLFVLLGDANSRPVKAFEALKINKFTLQGEIGKIPSTPKPRDDGEFQWSDCMVKLIEEASKLAGEGEVDELHLLEAISLVEDCLAVTKVFDPLGIEGPDVCLAIQYVR